MQRPVFFDQFELQAGSHGDKLAIDASDSSVSYASLSQESNRIAHALLHTGLKSRQGEVVGLFLPAGADYVAALLGVSKAGAAFMPLPVDLPPARLRAYLTKSQCRFIVTRPEHMARLDGAGVRSLTPADWAGLDGSQGPAIQIGPTDPCYVMFTSGSTGDPKAILGQHRGLSHFLRWELGELGLDDSVRGSWLAPITFDVSLRDMLVPLMAGGTICLPHEEVRTQPHRLMQWLHDSRVSLMHCVPTVLRLLNRVLADAGTQVPAVPALRHLLVAGEPLLASDVSTWRRLVGQSAQVFNLYGPSETTLAKLFLRVGELADDDHSVLPIGRTLPNTVVHILRDQRACTPGEIGEICIATPYRSLGYLNDPALTAAVFVRNPLSQDPADIIYRTGDLGRLLPDGTVQCLGRQDGQIKLNGIRIELAEIEAVLRHVPGVGQCACAVHAMSDQRSLLVAYYSLQPGLSEPIAPEVLREHLDQYLPAAMQPHRTMMLPAIPITVSGKINRKALPRPSELYYEAGGFTPAETATEHALAGVWAELLGLQDVGVTTDFQILGGDSLRAIRALMKTYQTCGVEISLKDFYALNTIRALAKHIDEMVGQTQVRAIARTPEQPSYPASPGQDRLWRLDRMGIAPSAYNLPTIYEIDGELDTTVLQQALRLVVQRHESLRTVFIEVNGRAHQKVLAELAVPVEVVDLRGSATAMAQAELLSRRNEDFAFDLARGPLLRMVVLRLPDAADGTPSQQLLFNIHHIISDVWSLSVLANELAAAYAALRSGTQPEWLPLTVQQRDVAAWQSDKLREGSLDGDRTYWQQQFATTPAALELPTDRPRPATQTFNGSTRRRRLSAENTAALQALALAQGCTLFALLDALVKVQLFRYSGQQDIVVGSPVAGRQHADLQGQIGYLVNVLALRDQVEASQPFEQLLAGVRQTVQDALAHQAYPFDLLVDGLNLARDMSRSPLFDVMIVVDTFDPVTLELEGTTVRSSGTENAWNFSRFDLVFHFQTEDDQLVLDLNYNSDLFDGARIERACAHFETLAEAATLAPHSMVGELPLLAPDELQALQTFSAGAVLQRSSHSIPALLAAVAREHAQRTAVLHRDRSWDHATLQSDSDTLAQHLRDRQGVVSGDCVGVWARRSYASLVALLGIMKAGAVYLPLDPVHPTARTQMLVRKSGSVLVLADDAAESKQVPDCGVRVQDVAAMLAEPLPAAQPLTLPAPGDAAYMIFTSGSTGEPKGVLCEHDGFVNMALSQIEAFGITAHDRVLQFASPSFDASLANIFMALLAGATVVLPEPLALESAEHFVEAVAATSTTVVTLPPSFLRTLERVPLPTLRVLITAGEAAPVQDLCHYAGSLLAFNAYGPTESSVCATLHRVSPTDATRARIPIGHPLPNTWLRVVDGRGRVVPIGVPGELLIGGAGVARGYHGDDMLTLARFSTDPDTGIRLYRSGDRVCWLEDGTLDFLGRNDDQVKVSGFRIELGEVEHALRRCTDVADGAVVPVPRADGSLALAAYYCNSPRIELWPSVAEFYVYDDVVYSSMANDVERNMRYSGAFAAHLKGKVVLDIGTGPFAILSRLAIEAGAAHVYAVDLLESTAAKARQTVARLGLADRITVLQGDARTIELPEKADVCISEIVGAIGGSEGAADIINHARRLLKDPSAMLPQRSVTRLAAVNLPADSFEWGFPEVAAHYVERIFADIGQPFDLRLCVKNLPANAIVSSAGVLEDLDYTQHMPLTASHEDELLITRAGPITGLLAWLQLHVDAEHVVDILENPASWLPVYIPLQLGDVVLEAGDRLQLTVARTLAQNGFNPDFSIRGRVLRASGQPLEFSVNCLHFGDGYRATPFYAKLFEAERVPRARRASAQDVRAELAQRLPAYAVPAYIMALDKLPLNVSGKVDRQALPSPAVAAPAGVVERAETAVERVVRQVWQVVLGRDSLGLHDDFFMLGGDSIRAIQIVSRLRRLGLKAEIRDIFQQPTVAALAPVVQPLGALAEQGEVRGNHAPTPILQWFLDLSGDAPHHFNQAVGLIGSERLQSPLVRQALQALWRHHDGLRLRLPGFPQVIMPTIQSADDAPVLVEINLETTAVAELEAAAAHLHRSFRLDGGGPLFGALLAHGPQRDHLLLAAHHFIVDRVSWDFLVEDFETAYQAAQQGQAALLPFKGSSVLDQAAFLQRVLEQADLGAMRDYMNSLQAPELAASPAYRAGDMVTLQETLDAASTGALMGSAAAQAGVRVEDLLLAGLAVALRECQGRHTTMVTLESHGRQWPQRFAELAQNLDLSRTVGWFTTYVPLQIELNTRQDLVAAAKDVRARREAIPDDGWSYSLLEWQPEMAATRARRRADIGFNYLGVMGTETAAGHFAVDWSPAGQTVGADTRSPHAMDLLGLVIDGCLELALTYNVTVMDAGQAQRLLHTVLQSLAAAARSFAVSATSATSAFTYQVLDDELDELLNLD